MAIIDTYHVPVLLKESIDGLAVQPGGIYVDTTYGGGGHSTEILRRLGPNGHLFAFDQDSDVEKNIVSDDRLTFVHSNFRYICQWMRYYGVDHIDGLLADLGVSSHHFDDASRGFSFRFDDAPLDMRMNRSATMTAADILNGYSEEQIADVLYLYGELRQARRLAAMIVKARAQHRITATKDLLQAVDPVVNGQRKKELAQLFQALRMEVNHELEALKDMLNGGARLLNEGGRLSVITYHSLEDRLVKNMMKTGNVEGKLKQDFFGRTDAPFRPVNGKPIVPSDEEQQANPRSRSAKLRVAERL